MATRFYLPSSGTPPLNSLAVRDDWEQSTGLVRLPTKTTKQDTALTSSNRTWPSTSTQQWCWYQYQSEQLAEAHSWTTADTVSMVMKCNQTTSSGDSHLAYIIRVVSEDGTVERGVIGLYHATSTELTIAATRIHSARTNGATAFNSQVGDRIIIELGVHGVTPAAESIQMRVGDPTATSDFALTSGLTTDLCPWVELSRTVSLGTVIACTANDIISGNPTTGTPTAVVTIPDTEATANNITAGAPIVESPIVVISIPFTANNITSGNSIVESPILQLDVTAIANDIIYANTIVETAIANVQINATANSILANNPVLETPITSIQITCIADDIVSGNPVVESPDVFSGIVGIPNDIISGNPILDTPTVNVAVTAVANNIISNASILGNPILTVTVNAIANDILSDNPAIGQPTADIIPIEPIGDINCIADNIISGSPIIDTPKCRVYVILIINGTLLISPGTYEIMKVDGTLNPILKIQQYAD